MEGKTSLDKINKDDAFEYLVHGEVKQRCGDPLPRATIRAFHKKLRNDDEALGEVATDDTGHYKLHYHLPQRADEAVPVVNLQIRISFGEKEELASSTIYYQAKSEEVIDFIVADQQSEYERIFNKIKTELDLSGLQQSVIPTLGDQEIEHLAAVTGIDAAKISCLVDAINLSEETKKPSELFYSLFRHGWTKSLPLLVGSNLEDSKKTVETAISRNIIDEGSVGNLEDIFKDLREHAINHLEEKEHLYHLLDISDLNADQQSAFFDAYLCHQGSMQIIWEHLEDDPAFSSDPDGLDRLKLSHEIAALTYNNLPLIEKLKNSRDDLKLPSVHSLAFWNAEEWIKHLDAGSLDSMQVRTDDEKRRYAEMLVKAFNDAMPTVSVARHLESTGDETHKSLADFLKKNDDFNLESTHIDSYFASSEILVKDEMLILKDDLKSLQRRYHLAPKAMRATLPTFGSSLEDSVPGQVRQKVRAMMTLEEMGLDSAFAIKRLGRASFLRKYAEAIGGGSDANAHAEVVSGDAAAIFENASRISDVALTLLASYHPQINLDLAVLPSAEADTGLPNWKDLFGSLDLCRCDHCNSVYGPAAYLVDLLHFLSNRSALSVLLERRPDIGEIELTCANTNTTLPYVDLVNEVLENAVSGTSVAHQTRWRSDELRATPEHINSAAYDDLKKAVYPFDLPFDLRHEQAAVYLKQIGVPHHQIMRTFGSDKSYCNPAKEEIAAAQLGLNLQDYRIITKQTGQQLSDFWGSQEMIGSWKEKGAKLSELLQQSRLDYKSLSELIGTDFVNPARKVKVTFTDMNYDLDKANIGPIDEDFLDRLHRFVRLQRKIGWTVFDLDKAITAFSAKDLDNKFLIQISQLEELRKDHIIPIDECLSWWSLIDTADYENHPSLYDRVFLDKSVEGSIFILNEMRNELRDVSQKITDHPVEVLSALKILNEDLYRLIDSEVKDELNLANLSRLYGIVSLCKALGLKISEFHSLKALCEIDPFNSPEDTLFFAKIFAKIRGSNFNIRDLDYIFRDVSAPEEINRLNEEIAQLISSLQNKLRAAGGNEKELIIQEISNAFDFDKITMGYLLEMIWLPNNLGIALKNANFQHHFETYYRNLLKAKMIVKGFKNGLSELKWFFGSNELKLATPTQTGVPLSSDLSTAVAITSDGRHAISGYDNGLLRIWDLETHEQVGDPLSCPSDHVTAVAVTPDGRHAISGSDNGLLRIWDLETHKQVGEPLSGVGGGGVVAVTVTPDGRHAISGHFHGLLRIWDLETHEKVGHDMNGHSSWVQAVAVTPDGRHAISGSSDCTLIIWDLETHKQVGDPLKGHTRDVHAIAVTPDGRHAISGSSDCTLIIWDLKTHKQVGDPLIDSHWGDSLVAVAVTPDGWHAISGSMGGHLIIWDLETHKQVGDPLSKNSGSISAVAVTPDGLSALSCSGGLWIWDLTKCWPITKLFGLFRTWEQLYDCVSFQSLSKGTWFDLLRLPREKTSLREYLMALQEQTGWNKADLMFLAGGSGLKLTLEDFTRSGTLLRLKECFDLLKQLNQPAHEVWSWRNFDISQETAEAIRNALKSKYEAGQWNTISGQLRDFLRERQRAALVTCLVGDGQKHKDASDLFEHFLIDVEMSPCMITSRIKQAISSVQLFIQRCMMNLESQVKFTEDDAAEWAWMKNYRVWEANRKVFLYPENYIEPELRDDKTPLFKDLENALMQDEMNDATAEGALYDYLHALNDISNLEIAGAYLEGDIPNQLSAILMESTYMYAVAVTPDGRHAISGSGDNTLRIWDLEAGSQRLHVFGRTRGMPHIYYHRMWINATFWTPWKRIDLSIQGDHLIPAVHNRRLYLIWPVFMTEAKPEITEKKEAPDAYHKISLAWEEYKDGRWSAQKQSTTSIGGNKSEKYKVNGKEEDDRHKFFFNVSSLSGNLIISIHKDKTLMDDYFQLTDNGDDFIVIANPGLSDDDLTYGQSPLYSENFNMGFKYRSNASDLKAFGFSADALLLRNAKGYSSLIPRQPGHTKNPVCDEIPFFFQDAQRTFLVRSSGDKLEFRTHYHPFGGEFIKTLTSSGVKGLLNPKSGIELQRQGVLREFFENEYKPSAALISQPYPIDEIAFSYGDAYSPYNWELFFHASMHIATKLSREQRFEEAQKWFHFIFDPMDVSADPSPDHFWKIKPFCRIFDDPVQRVLGRGDPIQALMMLIANRAAKKELSPEEKKAAEAIKKQIDAWRDDPFNPHHIARLRIPAYQKSLVMKYLDNLIAWGDYLFCQDSIESINEATQLYVMALEILGKRPEEIDQPKDRHNLTFNQLKDKLDEFSNALVEIENEVLSVAMGNTTGIQGNVGSSPPSPSLFFCLPRNEKLLSYWDLAEDRLFKIRHCMNIGGQVRALSLFQSPIEPGQLVRAAAAPGGGITAPSIAQVPLPSYRYRIMFQKSLEICSDVINLGSALLSALEKKDSETIAQLNSSQKVEMLKCIKDVREKQAEEADKAITALESGKKTTEEKKKHYEGKQKTNEYENAIFDLKSFAVSCEFTAAFFEFLAFAVTPIPDVTTGAAGVAASPVVVAEVGGGKKIADAMKSLATVSKTTSGALKTSAEIASFLSSQKEKEKERQYQAGILQKEIDQIDAQIETAKVRKEIAKKELENQEKQISLAKDADRIMQSKYTNKELYDWMASQVSSVYFQAYQLAYDLAERAERAYQFELCLPEDNFVQFGHWDSLKKGLLSGERLRLQLRRMDAAYLENNKREYEITKHISLAMLMPSAMLNLIKEGSCDLDLSETIFDMDYPGHYLRRIKSVSVSILSKRGPYTSVNCKLTMNKNSVRAKSTSPNPYPRQDNDDRFVDDYAAVQSIVTSSGVDDNGLFQLDLKDERYLPFEGAGAISKWKVEIPKEDNLFDFNTLADVIFHIRYTAREGGTGLQNAARTAVKEEIKQMLNKNGIMLSVKHSFPEAWGQFMNPSAGQGQDELGFVIGHGQFPYGLNIEILKFELYLPLREELIKESILNSLKISVTPPQGKNISGSFEASSGIPMAKFEFTPAAAFAGTWSMKFDEIPEALSKKAQNGSKRLNPDVVDDLLICFHCQVN